MKKTGLVCIELSLLFLRFSLQKNNIVSNVISWKRSFRFKVVSKQVVLIRTQAVKLHENFLHFR